MKEQFTRAFKVLFFYEDKMAEVEGLEYEGKLWLVPRWLDSADKKLRKPARMIRFDNLKHQPQPDAQRGYLLNLPIPKAVLEGQSGDGFEILEADEIPFAIPRGYH